MKPALALALFLAAAPSALAEPVRLLVAIGANVGDPDDPPLRYTGADADRIRRLFVELGAVSSDRAYLVVDQPAAVVRQRLAEVKGRVAELRAAGNDVVLLVYVSAHAQAGVLHLMGTHLPLSEIRDFAEHSGARLRVVVVDACDSGAIARLKGGKAGPAYDISLERLPLHGQVIITSSGPAQASEEWESLRGSLFTHHLLTGLRGDADAEGDGRITLAEAYGYAYRRTVASAARSSQHPAYDFDLAGTGELVLTEPAVAKSAIVFPAASSGQYVVASQPRADVVAEVDKVPGRPLRLAVPAGRYLIRKRNGRSTGLVQVELPFGGVREIGDRELVWRDFAEVALKGGALELRPWSVFLIGEVELGAVQGTGGRVSPGLALRRTFGPWWVRGALTGTERRYRGVDLSVRERSLGLGLSGGYRWLSGAVVPYAGLAADIVGVEQSFVRDREADIRPIYGALPDARALGLGVGPAAGVELPLPAGALLLIQAELIIRQLPSGDDAPQPTWRAIPQGSVAAGWRF